MRAKDRMIQQAKTIVKICGIRTEAEVAMLNVHRPDFAGFVFAPSRRRLEPADAAHLIGELGFSIRPVGVFVDETPERVAEIAHECGLHAVQLHGAEDAAYVAGLRRLLPVGVKVWKAVRVGSGAPIDSVGADLLLLDAAEPGGGRTFDWDAARAVDGPYMLAGGLTPDNLKEAIDRLHPYAVDASSGVEDETGFKNAAKVAAFLAIARGARP